MTFPTFMHLKVDWDFQRPFGFSKHWQRYAKIHYLTFILAAFGVRLRLRLKTKDSKGEQAK